MVNIFQPPILGRHFYKIFIQKNLIFQSKKITIEYTVGDLAYHKFSISI